MLGGCCGAEAATETRLQQLYCTPSYNPLWKHTVGSPWLPPSLAMQQFTSIVTWFNVGRWGPAPAGVEGVHLMRLPQPVRLLLHGLLARPLLLCLQPAAAIGGSPPAMYLTWLPCSATQWAKRATTGQNTVRLLLPDRTDWVACGEKPIDRLSCNG